MSDAHRKRILRHATMLPLCLMVSWLSLAFSDNCFGQESDSPLQEVWFDISKYFPVNNSLSLGGDTGIRGFAFEEEFTAIYIRPSLQYSLHDAASLHGGVGLFYAFQDGPFDIWEIRPWGGIKLRWPAVRSIYLENYFRAEGRFLRPQEVDEYLSVLRLRHRIGTVLPLADKKPGGKGFYLPVSFEAFFVGAGDIHAKLIKQMRFNVGLGYQLTSGWRLETTYNWIQSRTDAGDEFATSAHMIRIQIKG